MTPGARSATVEWSAPTITGNTPITSYDLRYRKDEPGAAWTEVLSIWSSGTLSYTLSGLEGETTYDIQVRARSGSGAGPWSKSETVEPELAAPAAPRRPSSRSIPGTPPSA